MFGVTADTVTSSTAFSLWVYFLFRVRHQEALPKFLRKTAMGIDSLFDRNSSSINLEQRYFCSTDSASLFP